MHEAVDERASIQAEDQDRAIAEGSKQRQRQGRVVGKLQHQPGRRHRLHPGADDRDGLPNVIATELPVLKCRRLHEPATARLRRGKRRSNAR